MVLYYHCVAESVLRRLLHHKMIQLPIADVHVSKWKREACEAVMKYLCSHGDDRLRPIQRDQHNRVCDVYNDQHKIAYFNKFIIMRLLFSIS